MKKKLFLRYNILVFKLINTYRGSYSCKVKPQRLVLHRLDRQRGRHIPYLARRKSGEKKNEKSFCWLCNIQLFLLSLCDLHAGKLQALESYHNFGLFSAFVEVVDAFFAKKRRMQKYQMVERGSFCVSSKLKTRNRHQKDFFFARRASSVVLSFL